MELRKLGSAGPHLSPIGFGGWEIGGDWGAAPSERELIDTMHAAFGAGLNWVDTAEAYGGGRSEEIVGRAVAGRPDILVATKVAPRPETGVDYVRRACEASLRRLGRDVIDLYQLHFPTPNLEATWSAMARLVDDGLVRFIGVSNFDRARIARCERIRHVDSVQPQLSLIWQEPRRALLQFCADNGIGVLTYGSLGYGLLTGKIDENTVFEQNDWRSGNTTGSLRLLYDLTFSPTVRRKHVAVARAVAEIAGRLGITCAELALAWNLHQVGVTSAIVGTRSSRHAEANARAGSIELSPADLASLDAAVAHVHSTPS